MVTWSWFSFNQLDTNQLYQILELRQAVFIVEQQCIYQDLDNLDQQSYHLCGYDDNRLVAYARIVKPGKRFTETSIGRVLTIKSIRGSGVGTQLVSQAINLSKALFSSSIRISAQHYLQAFYEGLGFSAVGEVYNEDNIPHIEMVLR